MVENYKFRVNKIDEIEEEPSVLSESLSIIDQVDVTASRDINLRHLAHSDEENVSSDEENFKESIDHSRKTIY